MMISFLIPKRIGVFSDLRDVALIFFDGTQKLEITWNDPILFVTETFCNTGSVEAPLRKNQHAKNPKCKAKGLQTLLARYPDKLPKMDARPMVNSCKKL
jgi:hypothetical protein